MDLGVSTIELDVQITEDGYAVATHDRDPNPRKCLDTAPAFAGDPEFPYVPGTRYIKDLTLAVRRAFFPQPGRTLGARPMRGRLAGLGP